jgi:hypothetical protein
MNLIKRPRGRPKSKATIEKERIEALFRNKPPHLIRDDGFTSSIDLERGKQIEDELLAAFPRSVSHHIIFAAYSHFEDPAEDIMVQALVAKALAAVSNGQILGGEITKQKSLKKATALWTKNQDLVVMMQTKGKADRTAWKIINAWDKRGIDCDPPSVNTIKNWFKQYTSN